MYTLVLVLHNVMRWVVLILAAVALVRAYSGWLGRRDWSRADRMAGSFFAISMDIQLVLGLILYFFLSPLMQQVFENFGDAMANPELRFYAIEHIFYMVVAVILVHVGNVVSRRAPTDIAKHRRAAIWFSLVVVVILIATPWARPLLRLG